MQDIGRNFWQIFLGDIAPLGWLMVAAYAFAAWTCALLSRAGSHAPGRLTGRRFWLLLALTLTALGVDRQFDLLSLLTESVRQLAKDGGWYASRHSVQIYFILGICWVGTLALAMFAWLSQPLSPGRALTLGGVSFLSVFVLIRAASLHQIDAMLERTIFGLKWDWILELSGIGLATSGALRERWLLQSRPVRRSPRRILA